MSQSRTRTRVSDDLLIFASGIGLAIAAFIPWTILHETIPSKYFAPVGFGYVGNSKAPSMLRWDSSGPPVVVRAFTLLAGCGLVWSAFAPSGHRRRYQWFAAASVLAIGTIAAVGRPPMFESGPNNSRFLPGPGSIVGLMALGALIASLIVRSQRSQH